MTGLIRGIFASAKSYLAVRFLLGFVFLYAGVTKLSDPEGFASIIGSFGLVPEEWNVLIAIILPVVEIMLAIGLLLDVRGALTGILVLILFFLSVLFYGIRLGLDIDCGCFGPEEDPEVYTYGDLRLSLVRDVLMLIGVIYLYWWRFTLLTLGGREKTVH